MKKIALCVVLLCVLCTSFVCYADGYSYVDIVSKTDVPKGTFIGGYQFAPGDENNVIIASNGVNSKRITVDGDRSDYRIIFNNNIYLFINITQDVIPDHKLSGTVRQNSPLYFFDENMELLSKKEFRGYMKFGKFENGYWYISFLDSSAYYYGENGFEGELSRHYYKTNNGIDFVEISEKEFCESNADEMIALCNGDFYHIDGDKMVLKKENTLFDVVSEKSKYNRKSMSTSLGTVLYKEQSDEKKEITAKAISYDGITYYSMPVNADLTSGKCTNQYIYYKIQGDSEKYYRVSIEKINSGVKVRYNNAYLSFEQPPVVEDGRTLVPMRFLFECLGDKVTWDEETRSVTAENKNSAVTFSLDSLTADVNGTEQTMDVPAKLIGDKTYVPLRFLSENLGYTVTWDEASNTAIVETK